MMFCRIKSLCEPSHMNMAAVALGGKTSRGLGLGGRWGATGGKRERSAARRAGAGDEAGDVSTTRPLGASGLTTSKIGEQQMWITFLRRARGPGGERTDRLARRLVD